MPADIFAAVTQLEDTVTAFLIADDKLTDDAAAVHDLAAKHGGKYLARSGNIETIEGAGLDTTLIALIQFPDWASLDAFVADPDDAPFAKARQDGSVSRLHVVDDTDLAGANPYLPKGLCRHRRRALRAAARAGR